MFIAMYIHTKYVAGAIPAYLFYKAFLFNDAL